MTIAKGRQRLEAFTRLARSSIFLCSVFSFLRSVKREEYTSGVPSSSTGPFWNGGGPRDFGAMDEDEDPLIVCCLAFRLIDVELHNLHLQLSPLP